MPVTPIRACVLRAIVFSTLFIFLPFSPGAHATLSRLIFGEAVLCEHLLSLNHVDQMVSDIRQKFPTENPLRLKIMDNVTDSALRRLNIGLIYPRPDAHVFAIQLVQHDGLSVYPVELEVSLKAGSTPHPMGRFGFSDSRPVVWQKMWLDQGESQKGHFQLISERPLTEEQILARKGILYGYVGDSDTSGVRAYLSIERNALVEVGLDVPCGRIQDYLETSFEGPKVLTPWVELCRVPVLRQR